jgi:hypothetical protein
MNAGNPWLSRVDPEVSDEQLERLTRQPGVVAVGLGALGPVTAAETLKRHLEHVFEPSSQTNRVIRRLLGVARAHLMLYYPGRIEYVKGINSKSSPLVPTPAICLTGLAGCGKTAIARALQRVLHGTATVDPGAGHPMATLESMWYIPVEASRALKDLLAFPLGNRGAEMAFLQSDARRIQWVSRLAFRDGLALLLVDEWQFITQSAAANTLATKLLHALRYVGLPLCFAANYSLCWRLMKRPQEDAQRLLVDPIVMLPDDPDDPSVTALYEEYRRVSDGALFANAGSVVEQVQSYTSGLKRSRIELLALAYRFARERKAHEVSAADLEKAYRAAEFTTYRREVEILHQQNVSGQKVREDLWCPFPLPPDVKAKAAKRAQDAEQKDVRQQALLSSLDANERHDYQQIQGEQKPSGQSPTAGASPRRPRRPPATLENLLEGAARFRGDRT